MSSQREVPPPFRPHPQSGRGNNFMWFYLQNFEVDDDCPKYEHFNQINTAVNRATEAEWRYIPGAPGSGLSHVPQRQAQFWYFLRGYASRAYVRNPNSNEASVHNFNLSQRRVQNIKDYLITIGIPNEQITGMSPVGSNWSNGPTEEDYRYRCVEVIINRTNVPPPPPPPPSQPPVQHFQLRAKFYQPDWYRFIPFLNDMGRNMREVKPNFFSRWVPLDLSLNLVQVEIKNMATNETKEFKFTSINLVFGVSANVLPDFAQTPGLMSTVDFLSAMITPATGVFTGNAYGDWVPFHTRGSVLSLADFDGVEVKFGDILNAQVANLNVIHDYCFLSFESRYLGANHQLPVSINPSTLRVNLNSIGFSVTGASLPFFAGRLESI